MPEAMLPAVWSACGRTGAFRQMARGQGHGAIQRAIERWSRIRSSYPSSVTRCSCRLRIMMRFSTQGALTFVRLPKHRSRRWVPESAVRLLPTHVSFAMPVSAGGICCGPC